jgi:hypothetical protein
VSKSKLWKIDNDPLKVKLSDKVRWPDYRVGITSHNRPHVITWESPQLRTRQGQVWSLAPEDSQWDSANYWVIPFDEPTTVVKVAKRYNRFTEIPASHYRY